MAKISLADIPNAEGAKITNIHYWSTITKQEGDTLRYYLADDSSQLKSFRTRELLGESLDLSAGRGFKNGRIEGINLVRLCGIKCWL
jgi:hypothetical protein